MTKTPTGLEKFTTTDLINAYELITSAEQTGKVRDNLFVLELEIARRRLKHVRGLNHYLRRLWHAISNRNLA